MDVEKLIHCLRCCSKVDAHNIGCDDCGLEYCGPECQQLCGTAATALSTLQAENAQLRADLEYEREHANAYYEECGQWEAENEKLRETVDKYATAARAIALHLKPFCDESLPYDEMIADAARKASDELEQVKAERDAAVSWAQKYTESIDMPCVACKHNTGDYVCTAICGNCGPMGAESCKWEFDFSGELKED